MNPLHLLLAAALLQAPALAQTYCLRSPLGNYTCSGPSGMQYFQRSPGGNYTIYDWSQPTRMPQRKRRPSSTYCMPLSGGSVYCY